MADKEFIKYIDNEGFERLKIKVHTVKGELIDVVVQYESFIDNNWTPILRYDCAHGFFHRDVLTPHGEKEKQPIAIENLNDALLYAEQDLKDRWKYYKQHYERKQKE